MKPIALVILAGGGLLLSVTSCHKSSMGFRGISGLGESISLGDSRRSQELRLPTRVLDAHVQLESAEDRFARQPGSGLEISFRGSNVTGGAILAANMDFYPKWEYPVKFDLVYCARAAEVVSLGRIEADIKKGKYHCLLFDAHGIDVAADSPKLVPWYQLAQRYGHPVVFHHPSLTGAVPRRFWSAEEMFSVAAKYSDLNFVIAQPGMPNPLSLLPLLEKSKNVYVVTSTLLDQPISQMSQARFEKDFRELVYRFTLQSRFLMFGSGWPHSQIAPFVELLSEALPEAEANTVFYDNAQRVFRISPRRGVAAAAAAAAAEAAAKEH